MNTNGQRIVLDTNILIAIIGKKSPYRWIFDKIIVGQLILCVSNEIVLEYHELLIRKNGREVAKNFIDFLAVHPFVEHYEPFYQFNIITQDTDDNKYVDCAVVAQAHCLVSNDGHFRVLKSVEFPKVELMTLEEFGQKWEN